MPLRNAQVINLDKKDRFTAVFFVSVSLLLIGAITACNHRSTTRLDYSSAQTEWREGDIIFRCGYGAESKAVTWRSAAHYSHVGLLHYDSLDNEWQVIHAVPAEDEPEYLKSEPVSVFLSPNRASSGAWLRVNCNDTIAQRAAQYALSKAEQQLLFDNEYLLEDSTQLYCTELVWRAYISQGIDVTSGHTQPVPTIFSREGKAIFPSDIEQSETTLFIKSLK